MAYNAPTPSSMRYPHPTPYPDSALTNSYVPYTDYASRYPPAPSSYSQQSQHAMLDTSTTANSDPISPLAPSASAFAYHTQRSGMPVYAHGHGHGDDYDFVDERRPSMPDLSSPYGKAPQGYAMGGSGFFDASHHAHAHAHAPSPSPSYALHNAGAGRQSYGGHSAEGDVSPVSPGEAHHLANGFPTGGMSIGTGAGGGGMQGGGANAIANASAVSGAPMSGPSSAPAHVTAHPIPGGGGFLPPASSHYALGSGPGAGEWASPTSEEEERARMGMGMALRQRASMPALHTHTHLDPYSPVHSTFDGASEGVDVSPGYHLPRGAYGSVYPSDAHHAGSGYSPRPHSSHLHDPYQGHLQPQDPSQQDSKTYSFVSLPGNAVKKRPRRRYDEIERLYACNWTGCTKSYGTLNHLNAHVSMQRHGTKRCPSEFKEMRKQWRRLKKEQELERERHAAQEMPMHGIPPSIAAHVHQTQHALHHFYNPAHQHQLQHQQDLMRRRRVTDPGLGLPMSGGYPGDVLAGSSSSGADAFGAPGPLSGGGPGGLEASSSYALPLHSSDYAQRSAYFPPSSSSSFSQQQQLPYPAHQQPSALVNVGVGMRHGHGGHVPHLSLSSLSPVSPAPAGPITPAESSFRFPPPHPPPPPSSSAHSFAYGGQQAHQHQHQHQQQHQRGPPTLYHTQSFSQLSQASNEDLGHGNGTIQGGGGASSSLGTGALPPDATLCAAYDPSGSATGVDKERSSEDGHSSIARGL